MKAKSPTNGICGFEMGLLHLNEKVGDMACVKVYHCTTRRSADRQCGFPKAGVGLGSGSRGYHLVQGFRYRREMHLNFYLSSSLSYGSHLDVPSLLDVALIRVQASWLVPGKAKDLHPSAGRYMSKI